MPKAVRSYRRLSAEDVRRLKGAAQRVDAEEGAAIRTRGRAYKREAERLIDVFRQLQAERQRQGLSLADVAERCEMDKGRLSRLENDPHPNVTLATIERFADALGVRVICTLTAKR